MTSDTIEGSDLTDSNHAQANVRRQSPGRVEFNSPLVRSEVLSVQKVRRVFDAHSDALGAQDPHRLPHRLNDRLSAGSSLGSAGKEPNPVASLERERDTASVLPEHRLNPNEGT